MSGLEHLNYRPNLKRDEREATAWVEQEELTTRLEDESGRLDESLPASAILEDYNELKENIREIVDSYEKELPNLQLEEDEHLKRALKETGHVSLFRPEDYKELYKKKESSPGAYLINVLEKAIEEDSKSIAWEKYIEYIELIEELEVLDHYTEKILYPIFNFNEKQIDSMDSFKEEEKKWQERYKQALKEHEKSEEAYKISLYTSPEEIPRKRDELFQKERVERRYRQEENQINITLQTIRDKTRLIQQYIEDLEKELDYSVEKNDLYEELIRLNESESENNEVLRTNILALKQSSDEENKKKKDFKDTRRHLYSKEKQIRIIDEYAIVNQMYRENVLPSVHQMRAYQDKVSEELSVLYDESAKALINTHKENREKAYETYLLQISTSQTRQKRLNCISNKHKSQTLYEFLFDTYKETN